VENADGWKTIKGVHCPWKGLEDTGRLKKAPECSGLMVRAWILMDD